MHKKSITELEKRLLTDSEFVECFWEKRPTLTLEEVLMRLVRIDANFTNGLLTREGASIYKVEGKGRLASLCLGLMGQKRGTTEKMKVAVEETVQALYDRVTEIKVVLPTLQAKIGSLSEQEFLQFSQDAKVQSFS